VRHERFLLPDGKNILAQARCHRHGLQRHTSNQAAPDQLAWSNTIDVAETDEQAMREAKPHLEAFVNRF